MKPRIQVPMADRTTGRQYAPLTCLCGILMFLTCAGEAASAGDQMRSVKAKFTEKELQPLSDFDLFVDSEESFSAKSGNNRVTVKLGKIQSMQCSVQGGDVQMDVHDIAGDTHHLLAERSQSLEFRCRIGKSMTSFAVPLGTIQSMTLAEENTPASQPSWKAGSIGAKMSWGDGTTADVVVWNCQQEKTPSLGGNGIEFLVGQGVSVRLPWPEVRTVVRQKDAHQQVEVTFADGKSLKGKPEDPEVLWEGMVATARGWTQLTTVEGEPIVLPISWYLSSSATYPLPQDQAVGFWEWTPMEGESFTGFYAGSYESGSLQNQAIEDHLSGMLSLAGKIDVRLKLQVSVTQVQIGWSDKAAEVAVELRNGQKLTRKLTGDAFDHIAGEGYFCWRMLGEHPVPGIAWARDMRGMKIVEKGIPTIPRGLPGEEGWEIELTDGNIYVVERLDAHHTGQVSLSPPPGYSWRITAPLTEGITSAAHDVVCPCPAGYMLIPLHCVASIRPAANELLLRKEAGGQVRRFSRFQRGFASKVDVPLRKDDITIFSFYIKYSGPTGTFDEIFAVPAHSIKEIRALFEPVKQRPDANPLESVHQKFAVVEMIDGTRQTVSNWTWDMPDLGKANRPFSDPDVACQALLAGQTDTRGGYVFRAFAVRHQQRMWRKVDVGALKRIWSETGQWRALLTDGTTAPCGKPSGQIDGEGSLGPVKLDLADLKSLTFQNEPTTRKAVDK